MRSSNGSPDSARKPTPIHFTSGLTISPEKELLSVHNIGVFGLSRFVATALNLLGFWSMK